MSPAKLPFADSDLAPLVKRYSSSTIVTLLREIAKCKTAKLDWGRLCKGTSTGITNPKELQALWRSVAYRAELEDSYDETDESLLEDDSDLEIELNPVPSVSSAVAETVSNFVKADLQQLELEEARLEQNAVKTGVAGDLSTGRVQQGSGLLDKPNDAAVTSNARRRPYLASATQCAATQGESTATLTCSTSTKVPYSGAVNQADRKRRRLWTPEEDLALIAAVDECGEGNWTTVLKNHYEFDRSASQLSQRWALIRKRREVQEKAGYGIGSGVSPLASGYKDLRPEGLKSGTLAGSGLQKDVGKAGNVPMPIKEPLPSTSSVPVPKRIPVASVPETTPASVLETQRVRTLPSSGVSSSWAGQRPQLHGQHHGQASVRAGASQVHKGAPAEGVRRSAQGSPIGSPMFYSSTQSSTIPIDSKYAASRTMGAGVARGGGSKGGHGPDPMIQAAAMAAGARIAPASAAASLLKAAQSGNVVHIGSGGLPRSKLGLTSQPGSCNSGGNPGIVHYIRTGSGGALAATSSGLQRNSSHHLSKNQANRSFGSSPGSGNSSPLSVPTVPAQGSRNNLQVPAQSSKPASLSKRGSSPQQKIAPVSNSTTSTPSSNPSSTTPPTPLSTPATASTSTSAPNSRSAPTLTSTLASKSTSTSTAVSTTTLAPAPNSTSTPTAVSTSTAPPALALTSASSSFSVSTSTTLAPAPKSTSAPTAVSNSTVPPAPRPASSPFSASTSTLDPAPKSASAPTTVSTSTSTPALSTASTPAPTVTATSAKVPKSISTSTPALAIKSSSASAPRPTSLSFPPPVPISTPASTPVLAHASASISTPASTPPSTNLSAPAIAPVSARSPASISTSVPSRVPESVSIPVSIPVSTIPAPAPKSASACVSIPPCGFNTAEPGIESPGQEKKGEFPQVLKNVTMSAKF